ncbi:hypothetical protein X777_02534 [Ooceraea biroi]|uniref:Uncharacterized protein n=1 Tax=Ooceraea biroi TaxID=2015173 RepID=A0A026WMX1_OOCBI|nr:hypothetical protein X777_02534 [Ooceraea biroi]
MRRLARRRNILAAFSAIMGRLGKGSQSATRPIFRVHYRKLVDEYSQQEQLRFMPALPDYMSYCCCRCGHTQKLKYIFDPIFDRFHVTPNKVLATRSNDIPALHTHRIAQASREFLASSQRPKSAQPNYAYYLSLSITL